MLLFSGMCRGISKRRQARAGTAAVMPPPSSRQKVGNVRWQDAEVMCRCLSICVEKSTHCTRHTEKSR